MIKVRKGQRVRLTNMRKVQMVIAGAVIFDYDSGRGNTGVIERIDKARYTKLVIKLDPPNVGSITVAPRYVKPAATGDKNGRAEQVRDSAPRRRRGQYRRRAGRG